MIGKFDLRVLELGLALILFPVVWAVAGDKPEPPPGGESLLPAGLKTATRLNGGTHGEMKWVRVNHPDFSEAMEVETRTRPGVPWNFQTVLPIQSPVKKGDVLWVGLWMRTLKSRSESGEGRSELALERSGEPYDKLVTMEFSSGEDWRPWAMAFTAPADYGPGQYHLCLRFGYNSQTVQIGGLQLLNYQHQKKVSALPRTALRYAGMEPDATWRKEAAERIERFRKADLRVEVVDAAGRPLPGAGVEIKQKTHAFGFGSCVVAGVITGRGADSEAYREVIKKSFSKAVMENDLKWPVWESGPERQKKTLEAIQWLRERNIPVRGHNLVWPSWDNCPKDLRSLKGDPAALRLRVENHIKDIMGATRGLLSDWDVVNEPFDNHDIQDVLGRDALCEWFKLARACDPAPALFLNDYAGFMSGGEDTEHKDHFEKTLRFLKDSGAPIGGVGIQSHFGNQLTPPDLIIKELDRWAALGLDIQITEFDLDVEDEEMQARYTRDFMTAVFSHPSTSAILTWGFWEKWHWRPRAAMYRTDWTLKPNGKAWNDLVLKEWHTEANLQTDATGSVAARGFLGDYEVTVQYMGKHRTLKPTLTTRGLVLRVAF